MAEISSNHPKNLNSNTKRIQSAENEFRKPGWREAGFWLSKRLHYNRSNTPLPSSQRQWQQVDE